MPTFHAQAWYPLPVCICKYNHLWRQHTWVFYLNYTYLPASPRHIKMQLDRTSTKFLCCFQVLATPHGLCRDQLYTEHSDNSLLSSTLQVQITLILITAWTENINRSNIPVMLYWILSQWSTTASNLHLISKPFEFFKVCISLWRRRHSTTQALCFFSAWSYSKQDRVCAASLSCRGWVH